MSFSKFNTRGLWISLILVFGLAISYWIIHYNIRPQSLTGNIQQVGVATPAIDPLKSGQPCFLSGTGTLRVNALGGATFDWRVNPPAPVLSVLGGQPANTLIGVGPEVIFTPPAANDPNFSNRYTVDVVNNGMLPGSGETFDIVLGPSCVTALEFVNPSGAVMPSNGEIQVNTIRALLSNGASVNYNGADIGQLGIKFVADPPGQIQFVGNKILVPNEFNDTSIYMELKGNALAPIVVDKNNKVLENNKDYVLVSNEVDPASVAVFGDNGAGGPGNLLEFGVHYRFKDVPHDNDPNTNDAVTWINVAAPPAHLFVSYLYRPSAATLRSKQPLTLTGSKCELLDARLYQGRGQGFLVPSPDIILGRGSTSEPFDFKTGIQSILITNPDPLSNPPGSRTFELNFLMKQGLRDRAALVNRVGNNYEIHVRDEGKTAATASNFAYAINTTLGEVSPFIAYINPADSVQIVLQSLEIGQHTNRYMCSVNGVVFGGNGFCFDLGVDSADIKDPNRILPVDPPRPLDPLLSQGDVRVVYSRGGYSNLIWRSSDASLFSVESLSEAAQGELLGNEHVTLNAVALTSQDFTVPQPGATIASTSNCVFEPVGQPPVQVLRSCQVTVQAPVTFNSDPKGYTIAITPPKGNPIPGMVQGDKVSGILSGSAAINADSGGTMQLTGQMTLSVGGSAIGTVKADVTILLAIAPYKSPADINTKWTITSVSGSLSKVNLIPTNRNPNANQNPVTNFALLTAKRPGKATLFVSDIKGCTAALDLEVLGEKLFIDFENPAQGEFLEEGDSVQLRAWKGFQGGVNSENDVTNLAKWETDNTDVITLSATGRLTALKPGVANITARYETGKPETGTLISQGKLRVHVNEIKDITINLDEQTLARLSPEQKQQAFKSVAVIVHQPSAAGRSITVEGKTVSIILPAPAVPYSSKVDQVKAIINGQPNVNDDGLIAELAANGKVRVTQHSKLPGVLLLEPTQQNDNGIIDITTTALPEELTIIPAFSGGITLPNNETYRLMAIAEYADGRTKRLLNTDVKWNAQPVNVLADAALVTGLLKRGDTAGTAQITAEVEGVGRTIRSLNQLTVHIEEGPVIEFVRVIGAGSITKGSRVNVLIRVSDIDTIEDVQEITASLVRSSESAYAGIKADPNAVWFEVNTFDDQLKPETPAPVPAPKPEDPKAPQPAPAPAASLFKNFTLPIEIPVNANLFDGPYKFVISITDKASHTTHFVLPFLIGQTVSGDVNGDGKLNMIDVLILFQIANGKVTATQKQLEAGNLDGRGGITMIDVILLFQKVNTKT